MLVRSVLLAGMFAYCFACLPVHAVQAQDDSASVEKLDDGWISLFNGKDLEGWKANENGDRTFSVKDGKIVVNGPVSHLFYDGPVEDHDFTNFVWKCEVMTKPNSNSGMYFHTKFQEDGWPSKGYEVQVNNTHGDPRKTGGLYAIVDVMNDAPAEDNEWFTQEVTVVGKHVIIKVNGKKTAEYTEPDNPERDPSMRDRLISSGTFALQGHDPGSTVMYRKVLVKPLPDDVEEAEAAIAADAE